MGNGFLDDEDELDLRPRRRASRTQTGTLERPRRSSRSLDSQDVSTDSAPRPVRKTRSDLMTEQTQRDGLSEQSGMVRTRKSDSTASPIRRKITNEIHEMDESPGFGSAGSYLGYIALALVFIAATVLCIKFLGMGIVTVIIIQVIMVAMGFILRQKPGFISVFLVFVILIAGMITGMTDVVLCGCATLLAAHLSLRD